MWNVFHHGQWGQVEWQRQVKDIMLTLRVCYTGELRVLDIELARLPEPSRAMDEYHDMTKPVS